MIRYWIESAAAYPGTYAALGTGMIGGFPKSKLDTTDRQWPESVAAAEAIRRDAATAATTASMPLPKYLSDNLGLVLSNPDFRRRAGPLFSAPDVQSLAAREVADPAGATGSGTPADWAFAGNERRRTDAAVRLRRHSDADYQSDSRALSAAASDISRRSSASTCRAFVPPRLRPRDETIWSSAR